MERLTKDGVKLKYILATHFHADFVSRHFDWSKKIDAKIVNGPNAKSEFEFISAKDNQDFTIHTIKI
jgi:glyoxylase-like metal-dependent hydrolase (beta-lactamase superfamily II)